MGVHGDIVAAVRSMRVLPLTSDLFTEFSRLTVQSILLIQKLFNPLLNCSFFGWGEEVAHGSYLKAHKNTTGKEELQYVSKLKPNIGRRKVAEMCPELHNYC